VRAIRRFTIHPALPAELAPLRALMLNLRWSWHAPTRALFAGIDPVAWDESGHDPVGLLARVSHERLAELAGDEAFLRGLGEAGEWCNTHQDEAAQLINDEFKIPIDDARKYIRYFDYSITLDKASRDELAQVSEYLVQQKVVPVAPDLSKFVTTEFMQAAYSGRT